MILPRIEKGSFHQRHLFQSFPVNHVLVLDDQPQAGGTVGSGNNVVFTHNIYNLLGNVPIIRFCHFNSLQFLFNSYDYALPGGQLERIVLGTAREMVLKFS